ncbi:hypothetical protein GCM10023205_27790 [Yinghuangia aomiensis]|uniref:Uncharacterized protein n=1 Tax=Yinghuangia aomiensis TaxID=676205 RepID=A0ABP9H6U2_9ACTN
MEDPGLRTPLDTVDVQGKAVTANALHTQHAHGVYLMSRGAHDIAVVRRNHPTLYEWVKNLPWRDIPLTHHTRDRAHHRDEIRRLKVTASSSLDCFGTPPRAMAGLPNLAISVFPQDGRTMIAAALRHTARNARRPRQVLRLD